MLLKTSLRVLREIRVDARFKQREVQLRNGTSGIKQREVVARPWTRSHHEGTSNARAISERRDGDIRRDDTSNQMRYGIGADKNRQSV